MQRIEIIGRIGADAEIKEFPTNQVISFSVAVSESYTNKQGEKLQILLGLIARNGATILKLPNTSEKEI